jgi:serine/threonine-protein kinase
VHLQGAPVSKCFKCGAPLEAGARFCGGCGAQQPGAVIPQAAVRSGAKTIFQGSGGAGTPKGKPSGASSSTPPGHDDASNLGYAATIAPPRSGARPAAPAPVRPPGSTGPRAAVPSAPVEEDLVGKTLNNRYLIEGKLGEGGFGSVYRAKQTQMNRDVALKVLHAQMARDPQVVGRFKREAQASSLLRAQHTVQVYDFDQTPEGVMYLAMEMLQGRSLHAILLQDGPIDPMRMVKVMDGIAESLGEAHAQGIVHRDIKPENIFLEPRPSPDFVKVLDFGIAKIVAGDGVKSGPQLTAVGQTLGTLEYMSPEQLMGQMLDGRSDLYALGILTFEMVTGQLPFDVKTPGEMITSHLKKVPPLMSAVAPERRIPPALDKVVARLLEKQREQRFKDTDELRAELARVTAAPAPSEPPRPEPQPSQDRPATTDQVKPLPPPATEQVASAVPTEGGARLPLLVGIALLVAALVGGALYYFAAR